MLNRLQKYSKELLLICTFLIFYGHSINLWGFFHDGYLYAALGKNFPWDSWLIPSQSASQFHEFSHHPPLFFILEGVFFKLFGSSFAAARIFGSLWVLASALITFHFIKKNYNSILASVSSILLLTLPSLMKKSRFPNMDQALLFSYLTCLLIYFEAYRNRSSKTMALSGLFWGLSLLIKGLSGVLILPLVFIHQLMVRKSLRFLLEREIWVAFIVGGLVFSLWPISLFSIGRFDIFLSYLDFQLFSTAISGRGETELNFFLYFFHLLKSAPHICFLTLLSVYLFVKGRIKEFREFYFFNLVCVVSYLLILSCMKFKYSHYLIPIYPFLSILAGFSVYSLVEKNLKRVTISYVAILIISFVVLFPLGVTNKVKRDKEVYEISKLFKSLERVPRNWVIVDNSYSYWAISGLSSYLYGANPYNLNSDEARKKALSLSDTLFVTRGSLMSSELKKSYKPLMSVESDLKFWVPKKSLKRKIE
ncbi:putative 4-amino-4-deoxy-l-arabinose lipid A transferase [Halobacteriovorax marinus SJ]|uniref:4-amino-4-deoxy-l-arabinose lipid A transferase n=1 Tax=Halobacteriovorax marinus (strain ATCC BAA-682 / DSM 15412 / SJ) TaxID=862908 RepID=E1X3W3_HALMS|nr:glycosyltransferase family 39 protein [Halobacteriovorax marinus]CBW25303.1 putative 4-amino-4-deoxy-l-arabinose lipid A transferase [Halobacteriovorax marinus SJ]